MIEDATPVARPTTPAAPRSTNNPFSATPDAPSTPSANPDDINAVVPTNEQNGQGVVIGPLQQVVIGLGWPQFSPNDVYIAVAGVSGSGNVYITPGSV
jgi:hypothetical protein